MNEQDMLDQLILAILVAGQSNNLSTEKQVKKAVELLKLINEGLSK